MAHADDPPWLRPAPTVVLSTNPDGSTSISPKTSEAAVPPAPPPSSNMPPTLTKSSQPTQLTTSSAIASTSNDNYAGWKPQPIASQQTAQAPPLSPPLDLAMYPGAPVDADPATVRKAVAGLKPLRILSSRRPGGPSSAGPSRPPSVNSTPSSSGATRSGFMSLISAAKRASSIATSGPSSSPSPQASTHSLSVSRAPIPVSPLPPPRTPPLVPSLRLAPELSNQVEPSLKAYLETLITQAASKPSSSAPSVPRRDSDIHAAKPGPIGLTEDDADILLEIHDLDAGQVISIRDLDAEAVNPSHTPNSIVGTADTSAIHESHPTPLSDPPSSRSP
ncbi:hypothetical protein FRC12_017272 [Ceratobasidium sp. 428]|nr:hypothetical protein FRC12_017272 [Ceratobasidium sp. 428]